VLQDQTPSSTPTTANATPQATSTVNNASIDRSSVATATKVGQGPQIFNCTTTVVLLTVVVALGSVFTAPPVGLFGVPAIRLVGVLSVWLAAVSFFLMSFHCCRACTTNKGQHEWNAALWKLFLFRTGFVSVDTMMATVKVVLQTVAFDACIALCSSVCQPSGKLVVGVVVVGEREHSARKIKIRGHCSAVRRRRCRAPRCFALVGFALVLFGGVDSGGAVFAPVDSAALKAAVGTCTRNSNTNPWTYSCTGGCLGENATGSCPIFSASNDATGNSYGVMGDWDVSTVTSLVNSTSSSFRSSVPWVSFIDFFFPHPFLLSSFLLRLFFFRLGPPRH
jgi:hypothetical protein